MEKTFKEKLELIAKPADPNWLENIKAKLVEKTWQSKSSLFALGVRQYLEDYNVSQKDLAEKLKMSPQQVSKILSGKENLTLSTISQVETALNQQFSAFGLEITDAEWYKENILSDNSSSEEVATKPTQLLNNSHTETENTEAA